MAAGAQQQRVVLQDLLVCLFVAVPRAAWCLHSRCHPCTSYAQRVNLTWSTTKRPSPQLRDACMTVCRFHKGSPTLHITGISAVDRIINSRCSKMWTFMVLLAVLLGCSAPPVVSRSNELMQQSGGSSLEASSLRGRVLLQNEGTAAHL